MWVKATKPEPPIPLPVESVSVEVWRQRRRVVTASATAQRAPRRPRPAGAGPPASRGDSSTAWSAPRGPNGGYLAAIVLRAMPGRGRRPVAAPALDHLHYLRRAAAGGPVRIDVVVERSGPHAHDARRARCRRTAARARRAGRASPATSAASADFARRDAPRSRRRASVEP